MRFLEPEQYQHLAERHYDILSKRIRLVLPLATVEHIGSSAIHGAISKGDLDIYVAVDVMELKAAVAKIERLGFRVKQGSLRTESLCPFELDPNANKGRSTNALTEIDIGIQLVARNSQFEFFLKFRDMLNANPQLRDRYNLLKLSSVSLDADDYRKIKSEFIESLLDGNQ